MNTNMKLGPIGQVSRSVSDIGKSEAWYRDVLQLPHLYTFGPLSFFDLGGTRLFLEENKEELHDKSVLYFRVENIEHAYQALRGRNVEFTNPPHMIHRHADGTEEWMAFFNDPDNRSLAIMCQVKPQSKSEGRQSAA